ncbi:MAG: 2-succinyl-5-enolpyruvyl-6-hydroxy-3-cyclohexene-1-carboxylic-acid synthase [Deltaproteobacteria bacterium]|nr:2-succinyl-5-enolpyruvyl-6-hydroxy-3-cyclohexene-1-carboxylic-acid synthase [Deltaproteobacteria bacterium]
MSHARAPHGPPSPAANDRLDATRGARLLIDALVAAGIGDVVMAPGSRSTPLVAACVADPRLRCRVVHDERSGAFVALGLGRGGRPAALLVTSGTAVANALPAVVEASVDHVPLVVLSADRPAEATGTDANQTIDQRFFFGAYARAFVDVPPPEDQPEPSALADAVFDVVAAAQRAPRGPVHVNARYRKPLEPTSTPSPGPAYRGHLRPAPVVDTATAAAFAELVALPAGGTGLLVAGSARDDDDTAGMAALARALGWPVVACATSGLRAPSWRDLPVLALAPLLARAGRALPAVDVVVRTGGGVVDDAVAALCARAARVVRVDDDERRRLEHAAATTVVHASPGALARALVSALAAAPGAQGTTSTTTTSASTATTTRPTAWDALRADDEVAAAALRAGDDKDDEGEDGVLDEPRVARLAASAALSSSQRLFVGNSVAIRAVDRFCPVAPRVVANRGASGIDGLLSTAAGLALAQGPTLALVGDVSFLHDAGALSALSAWGQVGLPLRVIVVDNRGGRIFDHLPIARHEALLSPYFTTPHDVDLVGVGRAYGVPAERLDGVAALRARLAAPLRGLELLVAVIDGDASVARHRRRVDHVAVALRSAR